MSFTEEISLRADDKASSVISGVTGQLRSLIRELGALAGLSVGIAGIAQLVRTGVAFNAVLEDTRIGIAGVVGSLHTFSNAQGEVLRGEAAWQAALRTSTSIQETLKVAALTTTAQYGEMVEAFQVGVGPMTRAGVALSDTAEATQRLTQVAAAASIPMAQLAIEIRQFFNGDAVRGRLLQTLQITKEQIEEHKRLGDMMDFIRKKTESFARAAQAAADSMTGRVSNLKDAVEQVLGAGLQPLYEQMKRSLGSLSEQFVTLGRDASGNLTAQFNRELVARVRDFGESLSVVLAKLTPLLATSVAFVASFLGAGAKAAAALSPLLDVLTGLLGLLTKVTDAVGAWAIGLWAVVKAFGAVEAAAKAALAASAAARAFGGGGGAGAAGTAAGAAAGAGAGSGLLATAGGGTALGIGAVAAALVYLGNQIAKEIGDKIGSWDPRVVASKRFLDTRTDSQVLSDVQGQSVADTLRSATERASVRGNHELALSILDIEKAYRAQTLSADGAIEKLREISKVGREAMKANKEAVDPTILQKYADAIEKIRGQITALGQTGLSAALTKSKTDYLGDMAALRRAGGEAGSEEEKRAILRQVDARVDLWKAEQAKAFRDYQNELAKQRLELAKESESIAQTWLEGGAREVAAISSKARETVAALEQERAQIAATDGAAVEKIKLYSDRIRQALERRGAEMAEWARTAWAKYRDVETQAIQTTLEAEGRDIEAQMMGLRERYRKLREDLNNALAGAMANPQADRALGQIVAALRAVEQAEAAEVDKLTRENRRRLAEVSGDWREMAREIEDRVRRGALNARDALRELGDSMIRFGKSYGEGALGALYKIMADIPTQAESAAAAVSGVWSSMTRAFDDLFFNVLSGRIDSLKDVFKNLWQSLLQTFSRFLSDMVQRWVKSQLEMKIASYGEQSAGFVGPPRSAAPGGGKSGGGWGSALGYLGAGMTGYGIGGSIGAGGAGNQWGGAIGAVGGFALGSTAGVIAGVGSAMGLGAAAGSVVPIIGTIVGAIVGAIIGGLFNKNTEKHLKGNISNMLPGSYQGWVGATKDPETGERTPGHWQTIRSTPSSSFEREGANVLQKQTAAFADLFRLGAKDQARELLETYQKALRASLNASYVTISAGSDEHIQQNYEYFLKTMLPRIGLSAAFGQKGYLPVGDRDRKGGIPGIDWRAPGMNNAGDWIERQLYSEDSPLFKMMVGIKDASGAYVDGLGFTVDKFAELAGRISTDDPEKLLAYITGIVGVVVGLRDLGAEMGKTFAELRQGWADEEAAGSAAVFGKRAQELADLFGELDLYSGDEQLKKAQEVQAASAEFWEGVKSYLTELQTLSEKLSAGLQGMREQMRVFLNPLSEDAGITADWTNVEGVWGKLFGAMDASEIEQATNDAAAAIERMFAVMAERVTRGNALLERTWDLFGKLDSLRGDVASDQLERDNPLRAWEKHLVDMQARVTKAATLSGLEQIAALEEVGASAEEMYANLKGFLADIANVSASINKSIDSQIWELGVGELDAAGQAGAVGQRIKELQDRLALATSPAEVAAIVSEIQSLTSRYVGQVGADDENRAEAIAWAQEQLERARGLANETLDALREAAEEQADVLQGILEGAADLLAANVTEATGIIGQLSHTLGELDKAIREAIDRLGQDALDSLAPLREAMDAAAKIFTDATADAALSLSGPEIGLGDAADRASGALGGFEDAVRRATSALRGGLAFGPGDGESSTQTVTTARQPSSARIVATVKRHSGSLRARVG